MAFDTTFYDRALSDSCAQSMRRLRMRTVRAAKETPDDRKNLAKMFATIKKQWGAEALAPIKLMADRHDVQCVPTRLSALDDIISGQTEKVDGKRRYIKGSGRGLPRGRVVEIFGPESSGKTTLALELIASYQERGMVAGFIDVEHALDFDYADAIGCDTDSWLYDQGCDTAEETLDMVTEMVRRSAMDLIVVDSVAALIPKAELEAGNDDPMRPGLHAALMSRALRRITALLKRGHRCTVVFINQTRMKIGGYGNPETTTGGNALKFYASVRLRIANAGEIKSGGEKGIRSKIKVRKTKLCVPYGECFIDICGGNGVTACYSAVSRPKDSTKDDDDDDDEED